jgi:hypothetical protein
METILGAYRVRLWLDNLTLYNWIGEADFATVPYPIIPHIP